jgi:hypothetical protein
LFFNLETSKNLSDLVLVGIGFESKILFDPLRLPYFNPKSNIEENIVIEEEDEKE